MRYLRIKIKDNSFYDSNGNKIGTIINGGVHILPFRRPLNWNGDRYVDTVLANIHSNRYWATTIEAQVIKEFCASLGYDLRLYLSEPPNTALQDPKVIYVETDGTHYQGYAPKETKKPPDVWFSARSSQSRPTKKVDKSAAKWSLRSARSTQRSLPTNRSLRERSQRSLPTKRSSSRSMDQAKRIKTQEQEALAKEVQAREAKEKQMQEDEALAQKIQVENDDEALAMQLQKEEDEAYAQQVARQKQIDADEAYARQLQIDDDEAYARQLQYAQGGKKSRKQPRVSRKQKIKRPSKSRKFLGFSRNSRRGLKP